MESVEFVVAQAGDRLDSCISAQFPEVSRSQIKKLIEAGEVAVNGVTVAKPGRKMASGDVVSLPIPNPAPPEFPQPESIPFSIVFADEHIFVIDKPSGLVVHPGAGNPRGTLVNGLLALDPAIASVGEPDRPGIVHRLDAETSGLIMAARTQQAYDALIPMFASHEVRRQYWAICHAPHLPDEGVFDTPYGRHPTQRVKYTSFVHFAAPPDAKRAVTHYRVLSRNAGGFALVTCSLETGRTHQIRVHLSEHGAPILGDALYSAPKIARHKAIGRVALHAGRLSFEHPVTHVPLELTAPIPQDMADALRSLHLQTEP